MLALVSIKRIIAIVITIMSVVVFTFVLVYAMKSSPDDIDSPQANALSVPIVPDTEASPTSPDSPEKILGEIIGSPVVLEIPRIEVNAKIQSVGISAKGNMAVPTNYSDVAWYRNGSKPGEIGTAVINGHLDNAFGFKGVFWDLPNVAVGDEVRIITDGGTPITFTVARIDEFAYNDPIAAQFVFKNESEPTLRLVTCSGNWLSSEKTYDKRLVVTAEQK